MSSNLSMTSPAGDMITSDKRQKLERRVRTSHLNFHAITGRRRNIRRTEDGSIKHHVDYHDAHIFWTALSILLLCVFDAHYTLLLLERGGAELNQLMDYLIQNTLFGFIFIKYTLTALSLFILVAYHQRLFFKTIKINYLIYGFLAMYAVLVIYEISIWPGALSEIYGF